MSDPKLEEMVRGFFRRWRLDYTGYEGEAEAQMVALLEQARREGAEGAAAERDGLIQTSGDICEACGWRGVRGDDGCAFCRVGVAEARAEKAEARVREVEEAAAQAVGADKVALVTLREDALRRLVSSETLRLRAEAENKALREALAAISYAATELQRSLRAWAMPRKGMGDNISQEDRTRAALALREYDRAYPRAEAALAGKAEEGILEDRVALKPERSRPPRSVKVAGK